MLWLLRHLLNASYLYAQNSLPTGFWGRANTAWVLFFALCLGIAWYGWQRAVRAGQPSGATRASVGFAAAGLVLASVRPFVTGALSARIWSLSAAALTLGGLLIHLLGGQAWFRRLGRWARRFAYQDAQKASVWELVAGLVLLGGLALLGSTQGLSIWPLALIAALWLGIAMLYGRAHGALWWRWAHLEPLSPLALPLLSAGLRWVVGVALGVDIDPYQAFPYPDPWSPWFNHEATWWAGMAGALMYALVLIARQRDVMRERLGVVAGIALVAGASAWYLLTVATHISHGATASDPYCYVQMAIDLATRGSARHEFPLLELAREADVALWPVVPVGYHAPAGGILAATVWPIGWPLLMAPLYLIDGELALGWAAPFCTLASALLAAALALGVYPADERRTGWLVAGLSVALLLTSPEAILRSLVPMADGAAQLLSVAMLCSLTLAHKKNRLIWSAIAGGCFAAAYWVRHPLLPLGLAALPLLWNAAWPARRRRQHLALFAGIALLIAIPDLLYHARAFGSPWTTESPEWFLISWRNIPSASDLLLKNGALRRAEFGYLWPLILCGAWVQGRCREQRGMALALWGGFLGVLGFALCYSALRWRDLIALFPWLALWAAWGAEALCQRLAQARAGWLPRYALGMLLLMALSSRTVSTLGWPWHERLWTFGHISAQERAEFARLEQLLSTDAIVGAGLNSGAIQLYSGVASVRPAVWSDEEWSRFVETAQQQGHPFYLLDDGEEIEQFLARGRSLDFCPIEELALPTFGLGGQRYDRDARLYRLCVRQAAQP